MDIFSHPIEGLFPVIYPDVKDFILSKIKLEKLMTSVAFLTRTQKKINIHKVMSFDGQIFLDCGIFQRGFYKKEFTWSDISNYRESLMEWYKFLKPDIASSLDLPNSLNSQRSVKLKRLNWSIENYKIMKKDLDIPLVLGISVFSENDVTLLKKMINSKLKEIPDLLGLGGMVPLMRLSETQKELGKIILKVISMIRKNFSHSTLHIYGFGDHRWYPLIRLLGASSSDYAGYINIASKGGILLPGLPYKHILKKIVRLKTRKGIVFYTRKDDRLFSRKELEKLQNCDCPFCKNSDPVLLEFNREGRILHNLYVILSENRKVEEYCFENNFEGLRRYIKETFYVKGNPMKTIAKYAVSLSYIM